MSIKSRAKSVISRSSGFLHSAFHIDSKPAVYVCGLLGTLSVGASGADNWMATDFVAIRHLIGAHDNLSTWLCGTSIREAGTFLLGDPGCDRIVFNPPPFETVLNVDPTKLCAEYTSKVKDLSAKLSYGDTLILVLVGHALKGTGAFVIGDPGHDSHRLLERGALEVYVSGTKGDVLLINTACYSATWESPFWSLIAAAGATQEAVSLVQSGSGQFRGGFFTNALIAEHVHEFQLHAPCPGSMNDDGNRGPQRVHDFGPDKITAPCCLLPKPSLQGVSDWIYRWRNQIGRTYTSADICFIPCMNDRSHSLPFLPLTSPTATLHRLPCVLPSPPLDLTSSSSASACPQPQVPTHQPVLLSTRDRDELATRALDLLQFMPINTATEISTIMRCSQVVYGGKRGNPLDEVSKSKLLAQLRNRAHQMELGLKVAKCLGWTEAVEKLGGPKGEQLPMYSLQEQAERSGCLVKSLIVCETKYQEWNAVASWLARVWDASGRPTVMRGDWDLAICLPA